MLKTLAYSSTNGKGETHAGAAAAAAGLLASRASSVEETLPSRTHTASHARTHDTNTKRNRNRFPDLGQLS